MTSEAFTAEEIIEKLGGPEQVRADLEAREAVLAYFIAHEEELVVQHAEKWAAVSVEGVVAVGDDMMAVWEKAKEQGYSNANCLLQYLDPDPPALLL